MTGRHPIRTGCLQSVPPGLPQGLTRKEITLAQLLSLQLGRLKDAGTMQPTQVSLAKWNNVRMAIDIAREARDLLGGSGITTTNMAAASVICASSSVGSGVSPPLLTVTVASAPSPSCRRSPSSAT